MSKEEDQLNNLSREERFKIAASNPLLAGIVYRVNEAENRRRTAEAQKKPPVVRPIIPTTVMQGDTRGLTQRQGLHTPTIQEIIARGNAPRSTEVVFDTNSNSMRQIDPLAPYTDFSGNFPKTVDPLKPVLKISHLG